MNILAFDTSMGACSAAVLATGDPSRPPARRFERLERGHAEAVVPMIQQVIAEAGADFRALDRIAVTVGPGTFTGVRIGVATGRGLALATGAPLVGVTSHAVMARQIVRSGAAPPEAVVAVAVDARRGQIYISLFDAAGEALSRPEALAPAAAVRLLPDEPVAAAGSGAALLADAAASSHDRVAVLFPDLQPDAAALAEMAAARALSTDPVRPLYLRPPDAKPQTGKAVPRLA